MDLKKCENCKTLFNSQNSPGSDLCADCYEKERRKYRMIKEYLWEHPGASVSEIADNIEIKEKTIRKFVRDGRFNLG